MALPFDGAISAFFKDAAPDDVRNAIKRAGARLFIDKTPRYVLIVDDLNTGIQVILPDQMRHDDFPQANSERPFRTAWGQGIFVTQYGY